MASISILEILEDTTVDGPGLRTTIYCAGCPNHCPGCHNPQSWDIANGHITDVDDILETILADPFADVTFSCGDPMFQAEGFNELAKKIKQNSCKNIWCYTGYLFEQLMENPAQRALLEHIDVLVDGRFVESLKSDELRFRGSSNQRVLDILESLRQGKAVTLEGF